MMYKRFLLLIIILGLALSACAPQSRQNVDLLAVLQVTPTPELPLSFTPFPTRPAYDPGQLVDYVAQDGDTLPSLAAHFNTSVAEILQANPIIPQDATSMPPGLPMKIPIYYLPLWGSMYQIIPDHAFVMGPTLIGFDTQAFINQHDGWLKDYSEYAGDANRSGAGVVDYVATNFSVSPRLLLAVLEYQSGALSQSSPPDDIYPLGYRERYHRGLYLQLVWAANILNNGFYGWRSGNLTQFDHPDGRTERPDPWQNAASVGVQYYYSRLYSGDKYLQATGPNGLAQTYAELFGDPWQSDTVIIPGSLQQPPFILPFESGRSWNFTGGPHTGWGAGEPYAAIDFAPTGVTQCTATGEWVIAMANGQVVREDTGVLVLDLDGDGNERTGWVIFYLHIRSDQKVALGTYVHAGDKLGHPSCEGGESTGTHVHIARKYNGEWIPADGPMALNLSGWVVHNGSRPYLGTLTRNALTVTASDKAEIQSLITAGE